LSSCLFDGSMFQLHIVFVMVLENFSVR
jgi:hypothetical protein